MTLEDPREKVEEWSEDYNTERPHSSLNNLTPVEFAAEKFAAQARVISFDLTNKYDYL